MAVRVVVEHERMVVFRLGRTHAGLVRGPGVRFLVPIVDRPVMVDLAEQRLLVPPQAMTTKDDARVLVEASLACRIVDPLKSVVNVAYFAGAVQGVAATSLRACIGDMLLADTPGRRGKIDERLLATLDGIVRRWGATMTEARVTRIDPAPAGM